MVVFMQIQEQTLASFKPNLSFSSPSLLLELPGLQTGVFSLEERKRGRTGRLDRIALRKRVFRACLLLFGLFVLPMARALAQKAEQIALMLAYVSEHPGYPLVVPDACLIS